MYHMVKKAISIVLSLMFVLLCISNTIVSSNATSKVYVTDAFNETFTRSNGKDTVNCRLPKLLLDGDDSIQANQNILNRFQNSIEESRSGYDMHEISYSYSINNGILSLVIKDYLVPSTAHYEFLVYNFNLTTNTRLNRDEFLRQNNYDWNKIVEVIKGIYRQYLPKWNQSGTLDQECYGNSISDSYLNQTELYLDNGKLYAICYWCSMMGSSPKSDRYDVFEIKGDIFSDEYFVLGRDSNQFQHRGATNISNISYKSQLIVDCSNSWNPLYNMCKVFCDSNFATSSDGICHGIALSLCYGQQGLLDYSSLNNGINTESYWGLGSPYDEGRETFKDLLVYYYLTQFTANGQPTKAFNLEGWTFVNPSKEKVQFLSSFVDEAKRSQREKKPFVFSFFFHDENNQNCGHSIVVCGYKYNENKKLHEIKVYDENTYRDNPYEAVPNYDTIVISSDYSNISFDDLCIQYGKSHRLNKDWFSLKYYGIDKLYGKTSDSISIKSGVAATSASNTTTLSLPVNKQFKMTNASGEYLEFDGANYDATMNVYDCGIDCNPNGEYVWNVVVDKSSKYVITDTSGDFSLLGETTEGGFYVESGSSDTVSIVRNKIILDGDSYDFNVALQTNTGKKFISLEGESSGTVVFDNRNNSISVVGNGQIENCIVTSYDNKGEAQSHEATSNSSIVVNNNTGNITSYENKGIVGDSDYDNNITIMDATLIQYYLANMADEYDLDLICSDVNDDKEVGIVDATYIQRYIAGIINGFSLPESVSLNYSSKQMNVGDSFTLKGSIIPSQVMYNDLTWESSNKSVATVNNGVVTAKAAGTATITATTHNGKTAKCNITVVPAPNSVTLNSSSISLDVGGTYQLSATVSPSDANDKTVSWNTSNSAVATVDSTGKITAKSSGSATITATTSNGKKASCTVYVNSIEVSSVSLNAYSITLDEQQTYQLSATVYPSNATNKTLTWSTNNSSVATVSSTGKVTAVSGGTANITAKTTNGKSVSCTVTVNEKIMPKSIEVLPEVLTLTVGNTFELNAKITPNNAVDKSVSWSSSNSNAVSVDQNGKLVANKAGMSATITARTVNGLTSTVKVDTVEKASQYGSFWGLGVKYDDKIYSAPVSKGPLYVSSSGDDLYFISEIDSEIYIGATLKLYITSGSSGVYDTKSIPVSYSTYDVSAHKGYIPISQYLNTHKGQYIRVYTELVLAKGQVVKPANLGTDDAIYLYMNE